MKPKDIEGILKVSNAMIKKNVEQVDKKIDKMEYYVKDALEAQERRSIKAIERAEKVKDGLNGKDGLDGKDGKNGIDGKNGLDGKNGKDGRNGTDGKNGRDGLNGRDGVGKDGKDGQDGHSAYELAVKNGYKGTETEWLESLKAELNMIPNQAVAGYTNPLPPRGTTGQVLAKKSNQDRDYAWVDQTGGGESSVVIHDDTLTGEGTVSNPLSVVPVADAVTSVFTRTGVVVATSGDYSLDQITQSALFRTVTDTEKSTWNAKEPAITKATGFNLALSTTVADIKMNGTQSLGVANTLPRADHVHPKDTTKQDTLVSNTNIKTVNGESILGTGNITVSGAVGGSTAYFLTSPVSNSTTTLADVTEWTFPVVSGNKYKVEIIGTYQTNTTTTGGKLAIYARDSAVTTIHGALWGAISDVQVATEIKATIYTCAASNATGSFLLTTGVATINRPHAIGGGMVIACSTSGNVRFQWAGEAATAAQLNTGSVLIVTPLN